MAGLHDIDKKDWERLLKDNGFQFERAGKHHIWKHEDGRIIPVPMGPKISAPVARRMKLRSMTEERIARCIGDMLAERKKQNENQNDR